MRSRPKVKLMLSPGVVSPGQRLLCEAVLSSRSETPVDYVSVCLRAVAKVGVGAGKGRAVYEGHFFEREWRSKPMKMFRGEMKFPVAFDVPSHAPGSYVGADASVTYTITVHVAIPWWPDRKQEFTLPVVVAAAPPLAPLPRTYATSAEGPRGKHAFMELALDATQIAIGDVVSGSISVQNLSGRRVRGVDISFVETETVQVPRFDVREGRRFTLRVVDGTPTEGAAIPFRVRLSETATPSFALASPGFQVTTHVEVRADVAWGEDILVRAPILVGPKATAPRADRGWVAPVGRERQMLVWQKAATTAGLVTDPEAQRMTGQRGAVTVEIGTDHRDNDFWLTAKLAWPDLGLELDVSERRWSDALALNVVKSGDEAVDNRLCAHAREHAQAKTIIAPAVLGTVLPFEEVKIGDLGAQLAIRGAPHVAEKLEPFVSHVLGVADAFDAAIRSIPAPTLFAADVAAWEALAARLRGRLELGRMWIHDAQVGTNAVEIGSVWGRGGLHLGSTVRVSVDPPLEHAPANVEDPALSPAARDAWRALAARSRGLQIEANGVTVELEGKLADPQTAMPVIELAVALRRALGGTMAAGPFR